MPSRSGTDLVRRAQPWLGTLVAITIRDAGDCPDVQAACDSAFAAVARVHALMSFHDPRSELSALNRDAARAPVAVSPWTRAVLERAVEVGAASGGRFDCAVAAALVRAGRLPAPQGAPAPLSPAGDSCGSHERLEFLPGDRIRYRRPMLIDLGGIAKGFAVDRAVEALHAAGIAAASVNAGGDLRVFGGTAETISVRRPDAPGRAMPMVTLHDAALATSAHYFGGWTAPEHGVQMTPFIDPRDGTCCGHGLSVTVVAPDCATADALTKVVLVSADEHDPALERFGAAARIITAPRPWELRA